MVWLWVNRVISSHGRLRGWRFELTSCYRKTTDSSPFCFLLGLLFLLNLSHSGEEHCCCLVAESKITQRRKRKKSKTKLSLAPSSLTNAGSDPIGTPGSAPGLARCPSVPSAEYQTFLCFPSRRTCCSQALLSCWNHCGTQPAQVSSSRAFVTKKGKGGDEGALHLCIFAVIISAMVFVSVIRHFSSYLQQVRASVLLPICHLTEMAFFVCWVQLQMQVSETATLESLMWLLGWRRTINKNMLCIL